MTLTRVFSDERRGFLTLGPKKAEGGQAILYPALEDSTVLLKLFKPDELSDDSEWLIDTVRAMISGVGGVAQIRGKVRPRPAGPMIGYEVDFIPGETLNEFTFRKERDRKHAMLSVASTFVELALRECYQSDGHYDNQIIYGPRCDAALIDVDSCSFGPVKRSDGQLAPRHFQNNAPGFGPAEFQGGDPLVIDEKVAGYVLAEILHRMCLDVHPSQVAAPNGHRYSNVESIKRGCYGRFDESALSKGGYEAINTETWKRLPTDIRFMFTQTFAYGRTLPVARPTPKQWLEVIEPWAKFKKPKARLFLAAGLAAAAVGAGIYYGIEMATHAAVAVEPPAAPPSSSLIWKR